MNSKSKATRLDEGIKRGKEVEIFLDGKPVKAYEGETIASALLSSEHWVSRTIGSKPLGVYCNIGHCHSCAMTVNGVSSVRICKTYVSDGCHVETRHFKKG